MNWFRYITSQSQFCVALQYINQETVPLIHKLIACPGTWPFSDGFLRETRTNDRFLTDDANRSS
jgi:hypothetical protein